MSKKKFLCLETVGFDMEEYGVDFVAGKVYYGNMETGYIDSGENGTSVWMNKSDFERYFKEYTKEMERDETISGLIAAAQKRCDSFLENSAISLNKEDISKD